MLFRLGKPGWRLLRRRLCAGVLLLAYVVAAVGVPVPDAPAKSAHACGQQVCGCGAAEREAGGCCCSHKAPETPPPEEKPGDCCAKKKPAASKDNASPKAPTKPKQNTVRWVVGISAMKCKTGTTHWLSADAALPMQAPATWRPSWPYCHSLPIINESPFAIAADLLDPPPRLEAV
jgi:hypothetical protein